MNRAELVDFEPSSGHMHACPEAGFDLAAACECAALLYCIAEDESIALHQARALLMEAQGFKALREWRPGLYASIDEFLKANP